MNKKSLEKLETELATLTARRDEIAADLATATADAQAAQSAMISGTGTAASLSAAKANRDALSEAHSAISVKIDAAQAEFESAQKATEKESALQATVQALEEYDAATIEFEAALRDFMASGKGEAVMQAASAVRGYERAESRAGLRSHIKAGALEYSRPCGNAQLIIGQLRDHIEGKKYASAPAVTGAAKTIYSSGFGEAGISVSSESDHGSPELHRAGIR
jgi:DNA repair exonuclease SbcCD ATPase subunit